MMVLIELGMLAYLQPACTVHACLTCKKAVGQSALSSLQSACIHSSALPRNSDCSCKVVKFLFQRGSVCKPSGCGHVYILLRSMEQLQDRHSLCGSCKKS